jgi:uracil-DNA glycosylase
MPAEERNLHSLRRGVEKCTACPLYRNATHGVCGEGSIRATLMLIGEQPGSDEDLAGHPFIGPAGRLLDSALEEAGLNREKIFLTNAVKHFKWIPRGKRRLHQKPNAMEVSACRPWLEAELALVKPKLLVCLGATAAYSVFGKAMKIERNRGKLLETPFGIPAVITMHPSAILRVPDRIARHKSFNALVHDLTEASKMAAGVRRARKPSARIHSMNSGSLTV